MTTADSTNGYSGKLEVNGPLFGTSRLSRLRSKALEIQVAENFLAGSGTGAQKGLIVEMQRSAERLAAMDGQHNANRLLVASTCET
jgi:hypothetical protein